MRRAALALVVGALAIACSSRQTAAPDGSPPPPSDAAPPPLSDAALPPSDAAPPCQLSFGATPLAVDPEFASAIVSLPTEGRELRPPGLGIDPRGRPVAWSRGDFFSDLPIFLVRLTPGGQRDESFGDHGVVQIPTVLDPNGGPDPRWLQADTMEIDRHGRILLAVEAPGGLAILRLTETGAPDPSFGPAHDGRVLLAGTLDVNAAEFVHLATDGDSVIVASHLRGNGRELVRLADDGSITATAPEPEVLVAIAAVGDRFLVAHAMEQLTEVDANGRVAAFAGGDPVSIVGPFATCGGCWGVPAMRVEPDGGVLALDTYGDTLVRLRADGTFDPDYGVGGRVAFAARNETPSHPGLLSRRCDGATIALAAENAGVQARVIDRRGTLVSTADHEPPSAGPEVRTSVAFDPATGAVIVMHTLSQQPGALAFTRLLP